jgi:hypothetical protein
VDDATDGLKIAIPDCDAGNYDLDQRQYHSERVEDEDGYDRPEELAIHVGMMFGVG